MPEGRMRKPLGPRVKIPKKTKKKSPCIRYTFPSLGLNGRGGGGWGGGGGGGQAIRKAKKVTPEVPTAVARLLNKARASSELYFVGL